MRWYVFGAVALLLAATSVVALILERRDDRDQVTVRMIHAPWRVIDVGRDGRSLTLLYETSGCLREDARAVVSESKFAIRIRVDQGKDEPLKPGSAENFGCTLDLSFGRVTARLQHPVAGRALHSSVQPLDTTAVGRPIPARAHESHGFLVFEVPRVIGLSPGDAVELLLHQGFRARVVDGRYGAVVGQRPRPGAPVRLTPRVRPLATVSLRVRP